ncbi:MAG: restriction endonuclease subunit S [Prevotellaceae bacterium]|jgi:type I restriction enzyme M protein|nr:restriction endonuclease subunit S [Prevotellaceae bacterium]
MSCKDLLLLLGFSPKENAVGIFSKKYPQADGYCIEVDLEKNAIDYGSLIRSDSKTTQNFSQPENFVVLECVNRLLEKGYKPQNIILEKTWAAGHGNSGRLDICVTRDDGAEYLLIECKTYGKEFEKAFARMEKDGGQLFTYFKFSNKADVIMLYASEPKGSEMVYRNEIVRIEDDYRTGDVKDFYERWNKLTKDNGVFEDEAKPYNFTGRKKITKNNLRKLDEVEGRSLFNKFATILRKHSVSDKPNAFNKIFNLFLAKLYDEQKKQNDELEFYWRDDDNPVDFQVRLFNLHKEGLRVFLEKELAGIYDKDFEGAKSHEELLERKKNVLKINKIYDIKEVFDDDTFEQNHRVLKEVVELLQKYQIRYPRKQQHLSEFFEQLLTTGLKQEAGQYFTPPTITKFIVKSLPLPQLLEGEINQPAPSLPATIDYAAGSGHFITEILEEYQDIIEKLDTSDFYPKAQSEVASWKADPYNWAAKYVYGIEKDYRLVKVAKVGCYFYGDGLAQVVLGDGLDNFEKSKSYVGLLKENAKKPQFSVLVSNPPYSVDGVKDDLEYIGAQNEFTLFKNLTENSSEIEALFVERAAQLLKENGMAGIVLPNSILSNTGIYAKAREIILQYFDVIAITQLGGNTFMATNTNTVVLFLRKRNEEDVERIKKTAYQLAEKYPKTHEDVTINSIEKPVQKYLDYTGETEVNPEKFYYFVLNYHRKTVIIKTGEKEEEKRFLGYTIVKRRGSEGYHPIQRGKTIDECTKLFDDNNFANSEKASIYIYKAFAGDYDFPISENLKNNISRVRLVDMLTFGREKFDKNISLVVKKKVRIESGWNLVRLGDVLFENDKSNIKVGTAKDLNNGDYPFFTSGENVFRFNEYLVDSQNIFLSTGGNAVVKFYDGKAAYSTDTFVVKSNNEETIKTKFLFYFLENKISMINEFYFKGIGLKHLQKPDFRNIQIPLPPLEIQQKIVSEIEALEKVEAAAKEKIEKCKKQIFSLLKECPKGKVSDLCHVADEKCNPQDNPNKEFLYLGLEHIESDTGLYAANYEKGQNILSAKNVFQKGDVLYGKLRPYLNKTIIAQEEGICSTDILVLKTNVPTILKYALLSEELVKQTTELMKGVSLPRIGVADFLNQKIPVPPLSEQQKIVSEIKKIEAHMAEAQKIVNEIPEQKSNVLKKYL